MSCDVYGRLIVGVEADWDDFWRDITTGLFKCPNGHPRSDDSFKNCPECGGRFAAEVVAHPTNPFRAYCAKQGERPEQVWEDWCDSWRVGQFGLHRAAAVTSSEDDELLRVFGKMMADTGNALEGAEGKRRSPRRRSGTSVPRSRRSRPSSGSRLRSRSTCPAT